MDPINYVASYQLAADQIRRAIQLGTYLPNERLPNERELAEQLGVSRATVREAIRAVTAEGLVKMRMGPQGGLVVLPQDISRAQMRAMLAEHRTAIEQLFDFRWAVETHSARLAAQRRSDEHLSAMREALAVMEETLAGPRDPAGSAVFKRADATFHLTIAEAGGNPMLLQAIEENRIQMFRPVGATLVLLVPNAAEHHDAIFNAIRLRATEKAARAMGAHIEQTRTALLGLTSPSKRARRSATKS